MFLRVTVDPFRSGDQMYFLGPNLSMTTRKDSKNIPNQYSVNCQAMSQKATQND